MTQQEDFFQSEAFRALLEAIERQYGKIEYFTVCHLPEESEEDGKREESMSDHLLQEAVAAVSLPDGRGIEVTIEGTQQLDRHTRQRTISITLQGERARQFLDDPSYEALYDAYGVVPEILMEGEQAITVESVHVRVL